MIWFWLALAHFLIVFGLFVFSQGGQNLGPFIATLGVVILLILIVSPARAHDPGHPEHDDWFASLKQPDNPSMSCCGPADAYWCDDVHVRKGKTFCTITDDRVIAGRTPFPVGTEIEIPDRKLKWDRGNPTGHTLVFLSSGGAVYCFVNGTGI